MTGNGHFHSVVYLLQGELDAESTWKNEASAVRWGKRAVEILSLPLYTRPCVSLFKGRSTSERPWATPTEVRAIDLVHLIMLVAATGSLLLDAAFRARETPLAD